MNDLTNEIKNCKFNTIGKIIVISIIMGLIVLSSYAYFPHIKITNEFFWFIKFISCIMVFMYITLVALLWLGVSGVVFLIYSWISLSYDIMKFYEIFFFPFKFIYYFSKFLFGNWNRFFWINRGKNGIRIY